MDHRNRKRSLADVVGIEAWHKPFDRKSREADLHVDVVFHTGRFGLDPDDPVRFQLSIRRAEVVVITPATEPVRVKPDSVVRDTPAVSATATTRRSVTRQAGAAVKVSAGAAPVAEIGAQAGGSAAIEQTTTASKSGAAIEALHMRTEDGDHRWILAPGAGGSLDGRPWDGSSPRLRLIDTRKDSTKGLEPSVRVEVRCLREDLTIDNPTLKDETTWEKLKRLPGHRNRVAAAQAVIRARLFEEGLIQEDADLGDPTLRMILAVAVAES